MYLVIIVIFRYYHVKIQIVVSFEYLNDCLIYIRVFKNIKL